MSFVVLSNYENQKVKKALEEVGFNDSEIPNYLDVILNVMSLVVSRNGVSTEWTVQKYSSKDKQQFFVAFVESVNSKYISCYGNLYFNESHFLQSLNKMSHLTEVCKYVHDTPNSTEVVIDVFDDYSYLLQITECFEWLNKVEVFENFFFYFTEKQAAAADAECKKAVSLLYEMKFYFYFFCQLNQHISAGVAFDSLNNVLVCFPSFEFFQISVEDFARDPNHLLTLVSTTNPKRSIDYKVRINQCNNHIKSYEKANMGTHLNDIGALQLEPEHVNVLHHIGIKILEALTTSFTLSNLRKTISWLQWRFRNSTVAVLFFIHNQINLFHEYEVLLKVINECEKHPTHVFYNNYTAGEHLCKHYKPIRKLPQYKSLPISKDLPPLEYDNIEDLKKCAKFYLKDVAGHVFANPPSKRNQKPRSDGQYYFTVIHTNNQNNIDGVKFIVAKTFNPSSTVDQANLKVASIQKIK